MAQLFFWGVWIYFVISGLMSGQALPLALLMATVFTFVTAMVLVLIVGFIRSIFG